MKICNENGTKKDEYPKVERGDLVEINAHNDKKVVAIVTENRLICLGNGNIWSSSGMWGASPPDKFRVVTDEYCLKRI